MLPTIAIHHRNRFERNPYFHYHPLHPTFG